MSFLQTNSAAVQEVERFKQAFLQEFGKRLTRDQLAAEFKQIMEQCNTRLEAYIKRGEKLSHEEVISVMRITQVDGVDRILNQLQNASSVKKK